MRNFLFILFVVAGLLFATIFAALNPGTTTLDLAFTEQEVPKSLAFALAFLFGWLFGLLCAGLVLMKSANDRRRLRKSLNLAEEEVRTLRSMPLHDAD